MTIEYDDKGKYYTNVIHKVPVPAIVQTTTALVRGLVHVRQDERLKDELENDERFLAMTEVTVTDQNGNITFNGPFLAIQKQQVVWVMPVHEDQHREGDQ